VISASLFVASLFSVYTRCIILLVAHNSLSVLMSIALKRNYLFARCS